MEAHNKYSNMSNETEEVLLRPVSLRSAETTNSSQQKGLLIREVASGSSETENGYSLTQQTNIFKIWGIEILTLAFAIGLLIAICILLAKYNDQVQPDWGNSGITLNALIATLAMLFRASIGFISYEILAQVKWDWISQCFRPMRDFELIDAASRGIYGSLRLLPLAALHQPQALVAILISVISLGIGPFMQQTMQTYQCHQIKSSNDGRSATITTANYVTFYSIEGGKSASSGGLHLLSISMQTAMQDALVNPTRDSNVGALFTCLSGNCTFPLLSNGPGDSEEDKITHSSIGMCNQCIDVYDFVHHTVGSPAFVLPVYTEDNSTLRAAEEPMRIVMGGQVSQSYDYMQTRLNQNLTWTSDAAPRGFINRSRWAVYNFTILVASTDHCSKLSNGSYSCPHSCWNGTRPCSDSPQAYGTPINYVAAACTIYPCLKNYRATIQGGKLLENVIRDTPLIRQPNITSNSLSMSDSLERVFTPFKAVQQPCLVNGTLYTSQNMSSASKVLGENATDTVLSLHDGWMDEDIHRPVYSNITAPRECIVELSSVTLGLFSETPFDNATCRYNTRTGDTDCTAYPGLARDATRRNMEPIMLRSLMRNNTASMDTIRENIDSFTFRTTAEMRKRGQGVRGPQKAVVTGDEWETKVCVRVVWGWLALPAVTLLVCSILLLWTIIKEELSHNGIPWKSSSYPALLRGCPGMERMGLKKMEEIAKGLELKLEKDKLS